MFAENVSWSDIQMFTGVDGSELRQKFTEHNIHSQSDADALYKKLEEEAKQTTYYDPKRNERQSIDIPEWKPNLLKGDKKPYNRRKIEKNILKGKVQIEVPLERQREFITDIKELPGEKFYDKWTAEFNKSNMYVYQQAKALAPNAAKKYLDIE